MHTDRTDSPRGDAPRAEPPAASRARLLVALALLAALGLLTWFTIDPSATLHLHGYTGGAFSFPDRDVPVRYIPLLLLALFAVRVLLANARARLESKSARQEPEEQAPPRASER